MYDPVSSQSRTMGMLCHLSAFSGVIIPFGHIFGPLLVWLLKGKEDSFVDENGKESLNFQLSMTIYMFISGILMFVLIGFLLLPILALAWLVLVIMGAVAANDGRVFRYPFTIRFIK